jgi:phage terminase large subunit
MPQWSRDLWGDYRYFVAYGGRGGGKSWAIARFLLLLGASKPIRVLCARELQVSIQESVHKLLADQVDALGLGALYEVLQTEIRAKNGTEFIFSGIRNNPTKIKSMEAIDFCWIEEAEKVSNSSWEILIPTIRKPDSRIIISFNPSEKSDPTYQRFIASNPPKTIVKKVSWRDNPWFPEELAAERDYLAKVDPDAHSHIWEGEPVSRSDTQVFRGRWRIESFEPKADWDGPYFGLDFGFAQDPSHGVEVWKHGSTLYFRHEVRGVGVDIDRLPEMLLRLGEKACERPIRCDNARPETISYLQRHGYSRAIGCRKWPNSVEDGVAWLRSHELVIHPDCRHLADEARLYSHKVDRLTGDILPEIVDANNHGWDAVRYALEPLIFGERDGLVNKNLATFGKSRGRI